MITEMKAGHLKDIDKPSEPFEVIGKIIPRYENENWTFTELLYEAPYLKSYQDEEDEEDEEADCLEYIDNTDKIIYLYYQDDKCVGKVKLRKNWNRYAYIEDIAVCKDFRGQGIGSALINISIEWAKHKNLHGLMASWTGITSMIVKTNNDAEGLLESVQVELKRLSPVSISRKLNLAIHPLWEARQPRGTFTTRERIMLGTMVKDARSWEDHLMVHGAVWDLVSIAAWRPFTVARLDVCRGDDLVRTSRGTTERWSQVVTHRLPQYSDDKSRKPSFLFWYDNIGARGVKRWLRLREAYTDALDPFLSILRSDEPWSDANVVQIGIVLEKLGYLIDIKKNNGAHLNKQNQLSFMEALQVILDDMPVTPFVGDDESENEVHENELSVDDTSDAWKRNIRAAYMGLKHADRTMPDSLDLINALRKSILVVRFWVAHQLGVHENVLKEGRKYDPLSKPFIGID